MSDSPLTSFAIGSLAASRGASELAELSASLFRGRVSAQRAPAVDLAGILQVAQQADNYIGHLERENEALRQENSRLRANAAIFDADWDRLKAWARWAEAELKRRPSAD